MLQVLVLSFLAVHNEAAITAISSIAYSGWLIQPAFQPGTDYVFVGCDSDSTIRDWCSASRRSQ